MQNITGLEDIRRNIACVLVSNVLEAAPKYLFWALEELNELPDTRFEILINLTGKSKMAFLTSYTKRVTKPWHTGGAQNNNFGAVSQKNLTKSLVTSSVAKATRNIERARVGP